MKILKDVSISMKKMQIIGKYSLVSGCEWWISRFRAKMHKRMRVSNGNEFDILAFGQEEHLM